MTQYISKDALVAWAKETYLCENASMIRKVCYKQLLEHLDTLEVKEVGVDFGDPKGDKSAKCIIDTKALEVKEVNLKEEIDKIWKPRFSLGWDDKSLLSVSYKGFEVIARHFFELGLNAQRKMSNVPNIDDSLEELGVDPTSKEAKIFKESYYIALEKLEAQKGEGV